MERLIFKDEERYSYNEAWKAMQEPSVGLEETNLERLFLFLYLDRE